MSGEIDDRLVGGEDSPDYSNENDTQERKLVCRVSSRYIPTSEQPSLFPSRVLKKSLVHWLLDVRYLFVTSCTIVASSMQLHRQSPVFKLID